jgi:ABC-2 type transport system ATP-binding protein
VSDVAILADDLAKRYDDVEALCGVSFAVPTGTVLGLLGPNGAGKTTAVRILTTLLDADAGRAEVLGLDVRGDAARVRASIGLAGQNAAVDENLTGAENLQLVGRLTHLSTDEIARRSVELLASFDLSDAADRLVRTYSGGMRRRIDLAAALVHRPPVLFLDEPTTGLDPRSRTELWAVIEDLVGGGTTVLLTTQYLEEADRLADQIVVIDHGTVIAEGTAAQLKARLGATIIDVGFTSSAIASDAARSLATVGAVSIDGSYVHITVTSGPTAMLDTVNILTDRQIEPVDLALREPTLDDVFLAITGHATEAEAADGAAGEQPRRRRRRSAA